jgi:transcription elongation factor GreA-like protein
VKNQAKTLPQLNQKVQDKIIENDGEIVYKDSSLIKAIFPEHKIEQAVRTYFEIVERFDQKAELHKGNRLTVFWQLK